MEEWAGLCSLTLHLLEEKFFPPDPNPEIFPKSFACRSDQICFEKYCEKSENFRKTCEKSGKKAKKAKIFRRQNCESNGNPASQ